MKRTIISDILKEKDPKKLEGEKILIKGWVRAFRSNRFIQINDGSCLATLQAVIEYEKFDEEILKKITTGSAVSIKGEIVASIGSKQSIEVQTSDIQVIGTAKPEECFEETLCFLKVLSCLCCSDCENTLFSECILLFLQFRL